MKRTHVVTVMTVALGATTVQTQEGQCLLLFVSLCDAVEDSEA